MMKQTSSVTKKELESFKARPNSENGIFVAKVNYPRIMSKESNMQKMLAPLSAMPRIRWYQFHSEWIKQLLTKSIQAGSKPPNSWVSKLRYDAIRMRTGKYIFNKEGFSKHIIKCLSVPSELVNSRKEI